MCGSRCCGLSDSSGDFLKTNDWSDFGPRCNYSVHLYSQIFTEYCHPGQCHLLKAAVDTVVATLQCSVPMARVELLDEVQRSISHKLHFVSYCPAACQCQYLFSSRESIPSRPSSPLHCQVQMRACNQYSGLDYPETPHLFLEFHGSEADVRIDRSLTIN